MFLALLCGIHQHTNVASSIHQRGTGNGVHSLFIFAQSLGVGNAHAVYVVLDRR